MPLVQMDNADPGLSESELDNLQRAIGKPLPEGLKWFLRQWNGGCPEPDSVPIRVADMSMLSLQQIYGTTGRFPITLANEYGADWIPKDCIAFAADGLGSSYLIGVSGERLEKVFFVDVEGNQEHTLHFVANSIRELLGMLCPEE